MASHTLRSRHQLGDFLFGPDFAKLRSGRRSGAQSSPSPTLENKSRTNMNTVGKEELLTSIMTLDNRQGNSALSARLGVTNLNYVTNSSKKERRKDTDKVDNAHFQKTGKNSRNFSRSPKSKVRTNPKQKETILNEETKVIAMDLEEDSEDDVRRSLDLQKEIDKEQEYQNQMNMIYNSPSYFEQYSADLQYQSGLHHPLQDQFLLDPHIMLQNPPMYFIALPHFESQLVYLPAGDSSCDLSYSGTSTPTTYSETSEDESSPDHHNLDHQQYGHNVPIELDEELNNLVLSIIAD